MTGLKWINMFFMKCDFDSLNKSYGKLVESAGQNWQIYKDVIWTFPRSEVFQTQTVRQRLSWVLNALRVYDPETGYVQGMNFIVAYFLLHMEESLAFWLMTALLERYELREIYNHEFWGMYIHSAIMDKLISTNLPTIHKHFQTLGMTPEIFLCDWAISFFCSYIPLSNLDIFFEWFFTCGWYIFHWLVLSILKYMEEEILRTQDIPQITECLKMLKDQKQMTPPPRHNWSIHW